VVPASTRFGEPDASTRRERERETVGDGPATSSSSPAVAMTARAAATSDVLAPAVAALARGKSYKQQRYERVALNKVNFAHPQIPNRAVI